MPSLFYAIMQEVYIYPKGRAAELQPDSIVHVLRGDAYLEDTVQNLKHGDMYTTSIKRELQEKTLEQCLEFFLLNRMHLKFRTGDQSEVKGCDIMQFYLDGKEVAYFPTDDEYVMQDFQSAMQYIIDAEEEQDL